MLAREGGDGGLLGLVAPLELHDLALVRLELLLALRDLGAELVDLALELVDLAAPLVLAEEGGLVLPALGERGLLRGEALRALGGVLLERGHRRRPRCASARSASCAWVRHLRALGVHRGHALA